MYLEALKIFCDVVRLRSFSRAAAVNRISQSAASQNVLQLEKSLGVRLLDRSKRPFELTPEGEVYFEGCRGLIERYAAVEAQVKAMNRQVAGTVSVAAIYSVGLSDMSRIVQRFSQSYPAATVRLAYLHPDRVYDAVVNEEADIGLVSFAKRRRGLVSLSWRSEPMVLVCPPSHHLAVFAEIRPGHLAGERMVGFDDGLTIRREIDRYLRRHHVEVDVGVAFDNIETIKHAVELGEGVAVLPEPTVAKEVRAGTLVAVPLAAPGLMRPLGILHRRSGQLSRTTQKFIEFIQQNGQHEPASESPGHGVESSDTEAAERASRMTALSENPEVSPAERRSRPGLGQGSKVTA